MPETASLAASSDHDDLNELVDRAVAVDAVIATHCRIDLMQTITNRMARQVMRRIEANHL